MFKSTLSGVLAILIAAQSAWAETRVLVDTAPSPEAFASMLGIELEPQPHTLTRGIQMHQADPTPAPQPAGNPARVARPGTQATRPEHETVAPAAARVTVAAPVNFNLDSAAIPASFTPYLDNLAIVLMSADARSKVLIISGHTDSQGAASYNLDLSEARADSVRRYLIERGVASRQLIALGKGESELIEGEESNHALNRRVEFRMAG